ncbi:MAG: amidohydrolase [bacterium]
MELRRWFHAHPEPSGEERETQAKVLAELAALGIEHRPAGRTGVIATVRGRAARPCIALRADLDALRIPEAETGLNAGYRSRNEGVSHACGHDGHVAMLLGAARWLEERRQELPGSVRLIFQPAEEAPPGGATAMIADGCLDGVDAAFGVHLVGHLDCGLVAVRPGPFMASPYTWTVTVRGRAGHHMDPTLCIDALALAARFVTEAPAVVRAALPEGARYVLGFGTFESGTQYNQTPDRAVVRGSFRVFEPAHAEVILAALVSLLARLRQEFARPGIPGLPETKLELPRGYPVLVNDPAFTRRAARVLRPHVPKLDDDTPPSLGAEDFAEYLYRVPGLFAFLGVRNPAKGITAVNHAPDFDIDEDVLALGTRVLILVATGFLADPGSWLAAPGAR